VVKNRLVRVAKAAPLLRDGLALWTAAFDALPTLELLVRPGTWVAEHTRMLDSILDDVLPDVLNAVYGLPEPIPVIRLAESVWSACTEAFYLDTLDPATTTRWREGVGTDLRRLLAVLAELGAVELTVGQPDPVYRADLDPDAELEPDDTAPLPPDAQDRLRAALAPDAGPVDLVSLTPLATRAVHAHLLREGRYAPLVGELSQAEPAQLLGMIAEHYSPETSAAEIAGWLAAHGGGECGLSRLLDGVRGCPFRTRAAAMLDVLAQTQPDRATFLQGLRTDHQLGPIATQILIDDNEITLDELAPADGLPAMAEQFIHLLEIGGPRRRDRRAHPAPAGQARDMVAAVLACGHPDHTGLDELRTLTQERLGHPRSGRATVHPLAGKSRPNRPHRNDADTRTPTARPLRLGENASPGRRGIWSEPWAVSEYLTAGRPGALPASPVSEPNKVLRQYGRHSRSSTSCRRDQRTAGHGRTCSVTRSNPGDVPSMNRTFIEDDPARRKQTVARLRRTDSGAGQRRVVGRPDGFGALAAAKQNIDVPEVLIGRRSVNYTIEWLLSANMASRSCSIRLIRESEIQNRTVALRRLSMVVRAHRMHTTTR
jgi:hypothetical protein